MIATYTNGVTTKTGVFLFTSKGIIPIVLNGDTLPGTGGGTQDGTVPEDIDGPWVNDNDDVAFAADHINAASSFEGSVFLKPFNQSLQALLLMGAAGPAGVGGTISSIGIGRPALNNSDVLSFNAESTGGLVGSFVGVTAPGKGVVVCAKQGDSAPGTTGTFDAAEAPFGNANLAGNTALFHSNIMGDPNNLQGIFSCKTRSPVPSWPLLFCRPASQPGLTVTDSKKTRLAPSLRCPTMKTGRQWESSSSSCRKRDPGKIQAGGVLAPASDSIAGASSSMRPLL